MTWQDRFESKINYEPNSGCWLWGGTMFSRSGYGMFKLEGRLALAHRISYEVHVGKIPRGRHLDHLCRIRSCVNPDHLEPVTPRVNILRGVGLSAENARKTHCPKGHPYSGDNLLNTSSGRQCRECGRVRSRERARAKYGYVPRPSDPATHCRAGHAMSGDNLYIDPRGHKHCRRCKQESKRRCRLRRAP